MAKPCATAGCGNTAAPRRRVCYTCRNRAYRARHPLRAAYQTLRGNARRRGKVFEITLAQFKAFCTQTNYLIGRGRTKDAYHIDRIEVDKGYTIDNIQVLTCSENVHKQLEYDYNTHERRMEFWVSVQKKNRTYPKTRPHSNYA